MLFLRWLITFYHSKHRVLLLRRQPAKPGNKLRKLCILALGFLIGGFFYALGLDRRLGGVNAHQIIGGYMKVF